MGSFAAQVYLDTLNVVKVITKDSLMCHTEALTNEIAGWQGLGGDAACDAQRQAVCPRPADILFGTTQGAQGSRRVG